MHRLVGMSALHWKASVVGASKTIGGETVAAAAAAAAAVGGILDEPLVAVPKVWRDHTGRWEDNVRWFQSSHVPVAQVLKQELPVLSRVSRAGPPPELPCTLSCQRGSSG
jgi:hypothetical protein